MSVPKEDLDGLEKWLGLRLGVLISQGEKIVDVLRAAGGAGATGAILQSAVHVVQAEGLANPGLSPQQMGVWKSLLPILAEQAATTVKGSDGPAQDQDKSHSKEDTSEQVKDRPLTKEEAAEILGFSVRKLERAMEKRQVEYEKYGTGKTATVRFRRAELEKFREKRKVHARGSPA